MNYDALPYPSLPVAQTHPERLATAGQRLAAVLNAALSHRSDDRE